MIENTMSELVDYSVWLKLLFIPTIGCLILAALAAEIHFNRKQAMKHSINHSHKHSVVPPVITPSINGKKHHDSLTHSFNERIKQLLNQPTEPPIKQQINRKSSGTDQTINPPVAVHYIQVNIVNSDNVSQSFTVDSNDALQKVVTTYLSQANNQTSDHSEKSLDIPSDDHTNDLSSKQSSPNQTRNGRSKDNVNSSVSKPTQSNNQSSLFSTNQFVKQLAPYSSNPAIHQTINQSISQSKNQSVILRYQGRKLPLDRSPAELGLVDQSIVQIEPDFLSLFTLIRRQINQTISQLNREYLIETNAKEQAEQSINHFHNRLQLQAQHTTELKQKTESLNQSVKDMEKEMASIQSQIDTVNQSVKQLVESIKEVDSGSNELIATRQSLEAHEKSLSEELSNRMKELDEIKAQLVIKTNERNIIKQKWRDSLRDIEVQEKELQIWKTKASRINQSKDKIERIEKQIADQATYQAKIEANQIEMKQLDEEIASIQAKQSIKQAKEKELQTIKQRLKQLERETKDSQKWKQSAKQLEGQVQEVERLKSSLKQGKAREKALELQMKELHHWRQRARAFEREVKELRGWKRARVEYARVRGELDWIPEFPVEGALDSSGGSDYGMSGSLNSSANQSSSLNSPDDQTSFFDSIRLSNNFSNSQSDQMVEFDFGDDNQDMYSLDQSVHPSMHNYDTMNSSLGDSVNQSMLYSNFPDHDEPFDLQSLLNRIDPSMNQPISQPVHDPLNHTITSPLRQAINHPSSNLNPLNLSLKPSMHHITQSSTQPITHLLSQPIGQLNSAHSQSMNQSILHSHSHQPVLPLHSPTHGSLNHSLNQSSNHPSDDENELLSAGRSERSIKQSINQSILSSKWPYESLNQQLSPIHQAINPAISPINQSMNAFRWSTQSMGSSTSPLLIIDDRARANSTDSSIQSINQSNNQSINQSNNWSRLYGRDQSMSQTMNELPPGLARFNSPLVIIDDAHDRQKQMR